MTIKLRNLNDLNTDDVAQNLTEVIARVQEQNPTLDLRRGVLHDLLAFYHALLATQLGANIKDYLSANSLDAIQRDPALADPALVDAVLSNFQVKRQPGTKAAGEVTIALSTNTTVIIAQGAVFQANGKRFLTEQVFTAKTEAGQINSSGDRLLTKVSDGRWVFTIPVVAADAGVSSLVRKDTLIVPETLPPNYITSFAASDFTGGRDAETNQALLARLQQGIAAKAPSNRVNMAAMLRADERFNRVVQTSIIGYGDAELIRGPRSILPINLPGRIDWYVRSEEQVVRKRLIKSAVLIEKTEDQRGIWQFSVDRNDAPGFYELANVRLPDMLGVSGGFTVALETRSLDLTGSGFFPDVSGAIEGAYTRFQTAIVQFRDHLTSTASFTIGVKKDYEVEARYVPLIGEIQDFISSRSVRSYGADVLVRAPVPCFVQLTLTINKRSGDADPDVNAVKAALAVAVNRVSFIGSLAASTLHDVIHGFLRNDMNVSAIDLFGRIRYANGSLRYLRSTEALTVPDEPGQMVSARTVQFFTAPEDIAIAVVSAVPSFV